VSDEESAPENLPVRVLGAQPFWHHGPVRRDVVYVPASPNYGARFHVAGGPGAWYASSTEQGAWAELFRHFLDDGVDPFEVRRRMGRVRVDGLRVLDLADGANCMALGITWDDLTSDDYAQCQRVAHLARERGLDGILSPSAALAGAATLVVFEGATHQITVELSRVRTPPPRLADLLGRIRLRRDMPREVRTLFRYVESLGGEAIRRRRR